MVIGTAALSCFFACEFPGGLGDGALAMHPFRFKTSEPWTLARPLAQQQATATIALDPLVLGLEPRPHVTAGVPGGMVPDHDQRLLAVVGQPFGQPPALLGGHVPDWTPRHEATAHGMGIRAPQAVAGERCGVGIVLVRGLLPQATRLRVSPGVQGGVGHAAPPPCIGKPDCPRGVPLDQWHAPSTPLFLRAYCGSGLVIQCVARCPLAPTRWMAQRLVASRSGRTVRPCAWQPWAARASVHRPVGLPKCRGG